MTVHIGSTLNAIFNYNSKHGTIQMSLVEVKSPIAMRRIPNIIIWYIISVGVHNRNIKNYCLFFEKQYG